jgi:hypothetical protein
MIKEMGFGRLFILAWMTSRSEYGGLMHPVEV